MGGLGTAFAFLQRDRPLLVHQQRLQDDDVV